MVIFKTKYCASLAEYEEKLRTLKPARIILKVQNDQRKKKQGAIGQSNGVQATAAGRQYTQASGNVQASNPLAQGMWKQMPSGIAGTTQGQPSGMAQVSTIRLMPTQAFQASVAPGSARMGSVECDAMIAELMDSLEKQSTLLNSVTTQLETARGDIQRVCVERDNLRGQVQSLTVDRNKLREHVLEQRAKMEECRQFGETMQATVAEIQTELRKHQAQDGNQILELRKQVSDFQIGFKLALVNNLCVAPCVATARQWILNVVSDGINAYGAEHRAAIEELVWDEMMLGETDGRIAYNPDAVVDGTLRPECIPNDLDQAKLLELLSATSIAPYQMSIYIPYIAKAWHRLDGAREFNALVDSHSRLENLVETITQRHDEHHRATVKMIEQGPAVNMSGASVDAASVDAASVDTASVLHGS